MTQAVKQIYLVANWKSHKTLDEAKEFVTGYNQSSPHSVILCPPFPYIVPLANIILENKSPLKLGSQDVSNYPFGAYTGAIAADMLRGLAKYCIVGHSERRKYFGETNDIVANKVRLALDADLTPILCVDEPYLESQLAFFTTDELRKMVIAYEPLAAIGSGKPDTPEQANEVAHRIIELSGVDIAVLYGGSVTTETVNDYIKEPKISGVLVGGASLNLDTWTSLVAAAN